MAKLNKVITGLQYADEFDAPTLGSVYTLSSSDLTRFSLADNPSNLRLKHGDSPFLVLMDVPDGDFLVEIGNTYMPKTDSDVAGLIVWKSMDDFIQLLEWCDPIKEEFITYPYMRLERKGITYTGYGSQDGSVWDLIGSVAFPDAGKIGLVIDGPDNENSVPFDVDYIRIYRSRYVELTNLPVGYVAKLYDPDMRLIETQIVEPNKAGVRFDVTNFLYPFQGRIRVFNEYTEMTTETLDIDLYGGDLYYYGDLLEVYMIDKDGSETLINQNAMSELGTMTGGDIEVRFRIKNDTYTTFHNVEIKVVPYGGVYGHQWVTLCVEKEDNTKGDWTRSLLIESMVPGEQRYFYMMVSRDASHILISTEPYRFTLLIMTD